MTKQRQNKLKQILLELTIIVGFALVLSVYLAAAESILVILLSDAFSSLFNSIKTVEFLPVFKILLIPNFIVLHIEFARMFKEHSIKETYNEKE